MAVKRTGTQVVESVFRIASIQPTRTVLGLTGAEFEGNRAGSRVGGIYSSCEFQGWTFLDARGILGQDLQRLARETGADACSMMAESTVWDLGMEYAKADGTLRTRWYLSSEEERPGAGRVYRKGDIMEAVEVNGEVMVVVAENVDSRGRVRIAKSRKALPGEKEKLPVKTKQRIQERERDLERSTGPVLPGEPPGVVIADDERLLQVLTGVGVPLAAFMDHYMGTFDWKRMELLPGRGASEPAFTAYFVAAPPSPPQVTGPRPSSENAEPKRQGFFARLRGRG